MTGREIEVLRLVALRLSNREIADRLIVSTRTVESHVSALLSKLGADNRRDLVIRGAALLQISDTGAGGGVEGALTTFVGRSEDLAALSALLESERLVTLAGPAGVGKSRLAVEVSRALREHSGSDVRIVDLAPARSEDDVADRFLAALGVPQVPGSPAVDGLARHGGDLQVLVTVDNCEHVTAALAVVIRTLLRAWPHSRVLATSREPLGLPGEVVRYVDPLAVPAPEAVDVAAVLASDAVRLLVDRAWSSGTGFSVTEENAAAVALLCRSLDGLPLAVELIAPRMRTFTPEQLVERLHDRMSLLASDRPGVPPRHRTLRGAIDSTFDTLSAEQRSLFTALSVFAGSFALEAAEDICAGTVSSDAVVNLFPRLVDRSLIVTLNAGATNRYRLLETLRQYAREKLPPQTLESLRARHAAYFCDLAQQAEPCLRSDAAPQWRQRLLAEEDNFTEALTWSLAHSPVDALGLVVALRRFWEDTDRRRSGFTWGERVLTLRADHLALRVRALLATATLVAPWDAQRLTELATEADDIARQLGDEDLAAQAAVCLGEARAYANTRDKPDMQPVQDALDYFRRTGQGWQTASALRVLSLKQIGTEALQTLTEARQLFADQGDRLQAGNCAFMMASLLVREVGDLERGRRIAHDALGTFRELGSQHEQSHALSVLAVADYCDGELERARATSLHCLDVFRRVADHRCASGSLLVLADIEDATGNAPQAIRHLRETLAVASLGAHARTIPLALEHMARLLMNSKPMAAISLFAAACAWPEHGEVEASCEVNLRTLRQSTAAAAYDEALQRGSVATLDDVRYIVNAAVEAAPPES